MSIELLILLVAYLLGSIPTGYLVVRRRLRTDIRQVGSGGTGATNVMRTAGKGAAAVTFLVDVGKGALAVWLAMRLTNGDWTWVGWAAVLVILGHIFPIWLSFRGGKGVATGLGIFFVLAPLALLSGLLLFIPIVYLGRYVSLGSIISTASIPFWIWLYHGIIWPLPPPDIYNLELIAIVISFLVIASHHQNIRRLVKGTENKLGASKS